MTLYVLCASTRHQILKSSKETEVKEMAETNSRNTQTEKNLQESICRNHRQGNKLYLFWCSEKEGYEQMSALF